MSFSFKLLLSFGARYFYIRKKFVSFFYIRKKPALMEQERLTVGAKFKFWISRPVWAWASGPVSKVKTKTLKKVNFSEVSEVSFYWTYRTRGVWDTQTVSNKAPGCLLPTNRGSRHVYHDRNETVRKVKLYPKAKYVYRLDSTDCSSYGQTFLGLPTNQIILAN